MRNAWYPAARKVSICSRESNPLSLTFSADGGNFFGEPERGFESHFERVQIAVVHADDFGAGGDGAFEFFRHRAPPPARPSRIARRVRARLAFRISESTAAISRIASAPCAAASTTWYSLVVKSLRKTGSCTAARAACRSSRLPWKNLRSVRTDKAPAPPASYSRAIAAGRKSVQRQPFAGGCFLDFRDYRRSSATQAGREIAGDRHTFSAARVSSTLRGTVACSNSAAFSSTIRAKIPGTEVVIRRIFILSSGCSLTLPLY